MKLLKKIKRKINKLLMMISSSAVLMFHHVTDEPEIKKSILMSYDNFIRFIDKFSCYAGINEILNGNAGRKFAITFDDGLADTYSLAYPALKERNIPFTIFVALDLLDAPGYITKEQLIELSRDSLVTIGSHCCSHQPLAKLICEEQEHELLDSKKGIEDIINKEVTVLAYPYGQQNADTMKILKKNKIYTACFLASGGGIKFFNTNRYKLPRLRVDDKTLDNVLYYLAK